MRYFDFIKEIKEISTSHILVNEYGEGDIYEYLNNGEHKYPCVFLTVTNLNTTDSGTDINFTLFYTDRLVENQANKTSIQSTGISVIKQILSRYEQLHPEYLLSNVNYTPFTEKFTDMCAGVFCDVVIENQIDTLENYDNECEEGAFTVKTITLTKNGVYDIVGYDSAIVAVEGDCHEYEELVDELTNTIEQQGVEIDALNTTIEQKDIIIYEKDEQINSVTTLSITENGVYTPPTDVLGYNEITVDVEGVGGNCEELEELVDGLNATIVEKDGEIQMLQQEVDLLNGDLNMAYAELEQKNEQINSVTTLSITENGVYTPPTDVLGYNEITVDVAGELTSKIKVAKLVVSPNCIVNNRWPGDKIIDTTEMNSMNSLFYNCNSLHYLDVSGWNTRNVTDLNGTFYNTSIYQIDLSDFDTRNVETMYRTFGYFGYSDTILDLSNWNTIKVENLDETFFNCFCHVVDISGWDATNVVQYTGFGNMSFIQSYVGGRTIWDVINNNITILNGLSVGSSPNSPVFSNTVDRASLRALINGLADTPFEDYTPTLRLGSTLTAKLTNEDIAVATAKNWTIA